MKDQVFVVGDVHGMDQPLEGLLSHWQPQEQTLVFLGDLIDRGPHIKEVVDRVRDLQARHGALVIKGNHEAMLEEFLTLPSQYADRYQRNGGMTTVAALTGISVEVLEGLSMDEKSRITGEKNPWLLPWLEERPLYIEYGPWLLVHAGINPALDDWRQTEPSRFVWIREDFYHQPNKSGKKIIFGHTPIQHLTGDTYRPEFPWVKETIMGIDGGAVYGGVLMGLVIDRMGGHLKTILVDAKTLSSQVTDHSICLEVENS